MLFVLWTGPIRWASWTLGTTVNQCLGGFLLAQSVVGGSASARKLTILLLTSSILTCDPGPKYPNLFFTHKKDVSNHRIYKAQVFTSFSNTGIVDFGVPGAGMWKLFAINKFNLSMLTRNKVSKSLLYPLDEFIQPQGLQEACVYTPF